MRTLLLLIFLLYAFSVVSCSPNNVKINDGLSSLFKDRNLSGSFVLLNNANNDFSVYNLNQYRDSAYHPGTGFQILNAMIAIEAGVLTDENTTLSGLDSSHSSIKKALGKDTLFFDSIAIKTGADPMKFWLDSLKYGIRNFSNDTASFWKNDAIKITPDEQLGFIKSLYFSQLPFQKRTQAIIKNLLIKESTSLYTLAYNTGVTLSNGSLIEVLTGWILENNHIYFFSLTTKAKQEQNMERESEQLLKDILKDYGFFKGTM